MKSCGSRLKVSAHPKRATRGRKRLWNPKLANKGPSIIPSNLCRERFKVSLPPSSARYQAKLAAETEKDVEKASAQLQEQRQKLEALQTQQSEDVRGISKQQKNTERYLAKRQLLMNKKDDCNRNIRDLGVLPEEAFEKYTNEKMDRVRPCATLALSHASLFRLPNSF